MAWLSFGKKETPELPSLSNLPSESVKLTDSSEEKVGVIVEELKVNDADSVPSVTREQSSFGQIRSSEPLFVRIDKFQDAKKNLEEIEKKLRDMEAILVKIGETNEREEKEVAGWKEDMRTIKSHLEEIDSNVFNKI